MNKSADEERLAQLKEKETEIYRSLGISIDEDIDQLTDLDCGDALRSCVNRERITSLGYILESKRELGGCSLGEVRTSKVNAIIARPFFIFGAWVEASVIAILVGLYFMGLISVGLGISIYMVSSLVTMGSLFLRFKSYRAGINEAAVKVEATMAKAEAFFDEFGAPDEPYRLCDIDRKMAELEKDGYEFTDELKARVQHLRVKHADAPIGSVMV